VVEPYGAKTLDDCVVESARPNKGRIRLERDGSIPSADEHSVAQARGGPGRRKSHGGAREPESIEVFEKGRADAKGSAFEAHGVPIAHRKIEYSVYSWIDARKERRPVR